MLKDITLGRYYPGNSFVHKLDPRTKIIMTILYMVIVFVVDSLWLFLPVAAFLILAVLCSHIPLRYMLQSLKPLRWILLIMFLINLFMTTTGETLIQFWVITIKTDSVIRAFFIVIRLVLLVAGTSLMTLTTTPIQLTDGLESLLNPLKKLKLPVHELSMMMTIALRFIPTLLDETDRIMRAQLARGADFESGNIFTRVKSLIPVMIPLFISAFKRADELALAMDSRCYHGDEGRTKMKIMRFAKSDLIASLCVIVFGTGIILCKAFVF